MKKVSLAFFTLILCNLIYSQDIINETGKEGKFIIRDSEQHEALVVDNGNVSISGELKIESMLIGKDTDGIVVWDSESKSLKIVSRIFNRKSPLSKPLETGAISLSVMDPYRPGDVDDPLDIVHNDDVIIIGSLAVGFDAVNGENFGFDTIRLKENNLRIHFDDTSNTASFPDNDWRIRINDSTNGGDEYFAIEDASAGRTPFRVEAGAPDHSLFVDNQGDVGFGTNNPVTELHTSDGDTPTLRLEQNGTSGWTPQTWDLAGNETNFFLRDVTNGSKLPFRIRPNAPTSSIDIEGTTGDIGIGKSSPVRTLHLYRDDSPVIRFEQFGTPDAQVWDVGIGGADKFFFIQDITNSNRVPFLIKPNAPNKSLWITDQGRLGIGTEFPAKHAHIYGNGQQALKIESTDDLAELLLDGNKTGNHWRILNAKNNGDLHFIGISTTYGSQPRMAIREDGRVGIGTKFPNTKFEVEFDTNAEVTLGQGTTDPDVTFISLRSPNGTKYFISVDNAGNLVTSTTKP